MWPTLISIGPLAIQSFGLMMVLGIFFGGFVWWQKGREEGFEEDNLMDVWLLAGVSGLLAGRFWYVLSHWPDFSGSWYRMMFITKYPGLAYEGVFGGVLLMLIIQAGRRKWKLWKLLEVGVYAWLVVEIFGWLGSFLAGSNLGKTTDRFWGLQFPGIEGRRHPVQLVLVVCFWLLFKLLRKWEKEYRSFSWYKGDKGEAKNGFLIGVYLIGLASFKMAVGLIMDLKGVRVYYWFYGALFGAGCLILLIRSGIYEKVLVKKEQNRPKINSNNLKIRKIKRKKKGFDFK